MIVRARRSATPRFPGQAGDVAELSLEGRARAERLRVGCSRRADALGRDIDDVAPGLECPSALTPRGPGGYHCPPAGLLPRDRGESYTSRALECSSRHPMWSARRPR